MLASISVSKQGSPESIQIRKNKRKLRVNKPRAGDITPTFKDLSHGSHQRNKLDFWKADRDAPKPLVIFSHGGEFCSGDKSKLSPSMLRALLDAGISVGEAESLKIHPGILIRTLHLFARGYAA